MAACGLDETVSELDEYFSDATVFAREKSPVSFSRRVDVGLAIGAEEDLGVFVAELEAVFAMKVLPPIGEEEQASGVLATCWATCWACAT